MDGKNGMIAGFSATVVLSMIMLMKGFMGMMPQVNAIQALTKISATYFGLPMLPWVGWVEHFLIGTVLWGLTFAATVRFWPGPYVIKGMLFSIAAWLLMMLIMMPMAGAGWFGMKLGIVAPVATLVLHLVYGSVLGGVFGALHERGRQHAHA
jgi:uncharacterized membrane protein YagU involved in acid resistance